LAGRDPDEAYRNFRDPMNEALGCITAGRLAVPQVHRFETDRVYAIVLRRGEPVRLRGVIPLLFSLGHQFRIVETEDRDRGPFKVRTVQYWYQFETSHRQELLAFHWTPDTDQTGQRRYPHLHVGSSMIASDAPLFPDRFNKVHIPTNRVSLESVIRFSIEELGVQALRADWMAVLERTEGAFAHWRTR
jgi:hypothetical protein